MNPLIRYVKKRMLLCFCIYLMPFVSALFAIKFLMWPSLSLKSLPVIVVAAWLGGLIFRFASIAHFETYSGKVTIIYIILLLRQKHIEIDAEQVNNIKIHKLVFVMNSDVELVTTKRYITFEI